MKVEFYRHNLGPLEKERVLQVLDSIMLTTGDVTREFERKFAAYMGRREVVAIASCTAALHLSLLALDIGPGDEVITTPMSFIATANAVLHAGATPVFVDVEPSTGNLDASLVEAAVTPRTRAIMPVHLYGQLCDMRALRALADRHRLALIEDAAHAIESTRDGVRVGDLATVSCYSFYATKNLACGEGGALATDDTALADKLRCLTLHGMTKGAGDRYTKRYEHYDMELCGWKYNLDNIHAALLVSQIDRLEGLLERREAIARRYEEAFADLEGVSFPRVLPGSRSARHLFTLWVPAARRDAMLGELQDRGVGVAVNFRPIHLMRFYRERFGFAPGAFPVAEEIGARTITLPLYPKLTDAEVEHVIGTVRSLLRG
jgi:dTDP-4-amino-4,6-dideoxygalactose transaminase